MPDFKQTALPCQSLGSTAMLVLLLAAPAVAAQRPDARNPPTADTPVKVFILAGQSNMQGHGFVKADPKRNGGRGSLEHLVKDPATAERFRHLRASEKTWAVRDDVWIHYLDRTGRLSVGFGADPDRIGPELGFGHVLGEALDEPVLLIKLAWGGKSLGKDFRPPSSGGEVGPYFTEIVKRTRAVLGDLTAHVPELGGRRYELAGFGWHQGWNDRINQAFNEEYEKNLANFIRDIRKELGEKNLPFVIAETGMSGPAEKHPRALSLMKAQAAVAEHKEFRGNVAFVSTRAFWRDKEASPTGQAYHWNTNAETYYLIGEAMGIAMKKLCAANHPPK
jgi:alpha-galactosidase